MSLENIQKYLSYDSKIMILRLEFMKQHKFEQIIYSYTAQIPYKTEQNT